MKILKFGGSSLKDISRIKNVVDIVKKESANSELAVVVSAIGGVTNKLIQISSKASEQDNSHKDDLKKLEDIKT